jgi:ribonuclease VapC
MVIDTSALVAITLSEALRWQLLEQAEAAPKRVVSSVSLLEAGIVLRARIGETAVPVLYQLVEELGIEVAPFDILQTKLAIAAFGRFGKGLGHPAQLNFGDCAVYALAESRGEPVLATGNDFAATDLIVARP